MSYITRADEALRETEKMLRGLVSEAVNAGDYAAVVQLASWARSVAEIVRTLPTSASTGDDRAAASSKPPAKVTPSILRGSRGGKKSLKDEYPRFYRQDDRLVRVAWSKREKKEYEHKAPHVVLRSLAAAMLEKGAGGRVFSTEEVLPIYDDEGTLIPSYQAYVGIALLKQTGLLDQHGRQGYSVPQPKELEKAVDAVWRNLPEGEKTRR